jgi:hypothetical protein
MIQNAINGKFLPKSVLLSRVCRQRIAILKSVCVLGNEGRFRTDMQNAQKTVLGWNAEQP